jgi:hypothetical protein
MNADEKTARGILAKSRMLIRTLTPTEVRFLNRAWREIFPPEMAKKLRAFLRKERRK